MRKIFTLLATSLALLTISRIHANAQNLLKESFDTTTTHYGFPPTGWTDTIIYNPGCCATSLGHTFNWEQGYSGDGTVSSGTGADPHTGNGDAFYNIYNIEPGGMADLITPSINFSAIASGGKVTLTFWVFNTYDYWDDYMDVYINTVPESSGATFLTEVDYDAYYGYGWQQYTIDLPSSFTGSSNYIIFESYSDYGYTDLYLDDISVDQYIDCSGSPLALGISGVDTICSNANFTLVDTENYYHSNMSYDWQTRPAGSASAWTDYATTSDPTLTTSISSSTDFRVVVTCNSTGQSDTSYVKNVYALPFYICYCKAPDYPLGGDTLNKIDSVAISGTTLHNATYNALPGSYKEFFPTTANTTANLSQGGNYNLFASYAAPNYGMAWIDYNGDGYFSSSEYISINTSLSSNGTKNFTVPISASTGLTGMRIRNSGVYYPYSFYNCDNFPDGEVEDYVINITPQPAKDLGATVVTSPSYNSFACANTVSTVNATVFNYGSTSVNDFEVYATYSGPATGTIYTHYTGTLNPLSSATVTVGTINPPLGGTYKIKVYTVLSGDTININDTAVSSFNLYALPDNPTLRADTVCPGHDATIGIVADTRFSYRWYTDPNSGSYFYTDTTYTLYGLSSDTLFYVTAVDPGTGCESIRTPLSAAVGNPPTVDLGPDATICESPSFMLDAGNPGATYRWNTGDTTEKIHARVSGTYSVTVYKYCSASDSINLTVKPLPKANGIDYVRAGNTYSFGASGVEYANSYYWLFGDGDTSTEVNPIHTYATSALYSVTLVLYNDCGTDTVKWNIPTWINSVGGQESLISLYPNPASTNVQVSGENVTIKEVMIINSVGVVVYRGMINDRTGRIDISSLPSGNYILRANTTKGYFSKLFEVSH